MKIKEESFNPIFDNKERRHVEKKEQWRALCKKMPFLDFPAGVSVKVIPPFAGAVARFIMSNGEREISVYADFFDALDFYEEPYWEAYPINGDTFRCEINESELLVKTIMEEFERS